MQFGIEGIDAWKCGRVRVGAGGRFVLRRSVLRRAVRSPGRDLRPVSRGAGTPARSSRWSMSAQRPSSVMPARSIPASRPQMRSVTMLADPHAMVQPR